MGPHVQAHAGEDLRDFFQGSHAAGQRYEHIAQLDHLRLALAHSLAHDKLGEVVLGHAGLDEERGLHADDGRASFERSARYGAHEPHGTAAVDEGVPILGDPGAQRVGGLGEARVVAGVRPAVHGNVHEALLGSGFRLIGESRSIARHFRSGKRSEGGGQAALGPAQVAWRAGVR